MSWPRLWRLFATPRPGSLWTDGGGGTLRVCYLEGSPGPRQVVLSVPALDELSGRSWLFPVPLGKFRRDWVWMREVVA